MNDELTARQRAIGLRLAGQPVRAICAAVGRSDRWFHKWWGRYLEAGPEGLYDLTRANHHVSQRIPPELERAIVSVRRRLQAHASPATRSSLIGAGTIRAERKRLGVRPLPCERTIEVSVQKNCKTRLLRRLGRCQPCEAGGDKRSHGVPLETGVGALRVSQPEERIRGGTSAGFWATVRHSAS
jgi:hypothetical protein